MKKERRKKKRLPLRAESNGWHIKKVTALTPEMVIYLQRLNQRAFQKTIHLQAGEHRFVCSGCCEDITMLNFRYSRNICPECWVRQN